MGVHFHQPHSRALMRKEAKRRYFKKFDDPAFRERVILKGIAAARPWRPMTKPVPDWTAEEVPASAYHEVEA